MKILLPPSETKRPGGAGAPLTLASLAFPVLTEHRARVIDTLIALSSDEHEARRVLKLGVRQLGAIVQNRALYTSPTMAAVDRYTGVLFDALDALSLSPVSRRWLGAHAWIHSAPFGPVGALDEIPTYRLAAGTALPGMQSLKRHWSLATTSAIEAEDPRFVLDLRSEAYVALGPVSPSISSAYVRVVTPHGRALNHFNKKAKGFLVRALAEDRPQCGSSRAVCIWAARRGLLMREADRGVLELVTES